MFSVLLVALLLGISPQATTFKVSGTVVRDDNRDPATAAQANQVRLSGPITTIVPIRPDGTFEFVNARPGTYQLVVGPRITMSPMTVVVSDKDVAGLRVVVPITLDISGRVNVEGDGPRPRFQLSFARTDRAGTNSVTTTVAATFTVPLPVGEYRITTNGLPAGYSLKAVTLGNVDALNQPFKIDPGSQGAFSIVLGVSSPPPWVRVSGRVTGGNATSVSLSGTPLVEALTVPVGPNGVFEFPKVLPGNYTARTVPVIALAPLTPVSVGTTDLTNVELRIPATKEVSGKITIRGTVAAPRLVFSLANGSAPAPNTPNAITIVQGVVTGTGNVSVPTNAGPDGLFKVTMPEGERSISILPGSVPPGYSVDSFMYGSTDLRKSPVIKVALTDTAEFAIVLDATGVRPHNISGKVNGLLTTQGVRVVLQGGNLGTGVESPVATDGSFSFPDVLPGNYSARLSLSGHVISTNVIVGNSDASVTINYPRLFSIGAHVLVEGDSADPPNIPPVTLEARSSTGAVVRSSPSSGSPSPMVLTVSDGDHRISVPNVPAGYTLKSVRYGTVDLQEAPLKVDGPITWEIVVRLVKTRR
jgi:hypothetical protein